MSLRSMMKLAFLICIIPIPIVLVGCGSSPVPLVPVSGVVLGSDGVPLDSAHVMFFPLDNYKQFATTYKTIPFSLTRNGGKFCMIIKAETPGIPPGRYQITVKNLSREQDIVVPSRYTDSETTPLEVTITEVGNTQLIIKLGET